MKESFSFVFVFVFLILRGCQACFRDDSVTNRSFTSGSSIYEDCCCLESANKEYLLWRDPDDKIIEPLGPGTESNVYIEEHGDCVSLHIPRSSPSMSGSYKCVTSFEGLQHYEIHNLDIYEPLYFIHAPLTQAITVDSNGLIKCEARGASKPYIRWYKDTDGLHEIDSKTGKYNFVYEGLRVNNVTENDAGIYRCSASVLSTGEELDVDIEVIVNTPPVITELSADPEATLVAGQFLSIECIAEGQPAPQYNWSKIPTTATDDSRNKTSEKSWKQSNGTIYFDNLQVNDSGIYECNAGNEVGTVTKQIKIEVFDIPQILSFEDISVTEGTEIPLICNVTGVPVPNITITYEGRSLEEEKESPFEEYVPNMVLFKVDRSKEGYYMCNATNIVGFSASMMYLSVEHAPIFNVVSEDVWGWNGEVIIMNCDYESNPLASTVWTYRDNMNITRTIKLNATKIEFLIDDDNNDPYGIYTCTAKNSHGSASKTFNLMRGYPPSAVQNATTKEEAATSWTFDLIPPIDYEGPEVIGFTGEYDEIENYNITDVHPDRTWALGRPFKLEKLKPNTTYMVKFAAINRVGTGPWSELMIFDTLEKSAPEPPEFKVDAVQVLANKKIKWSEPEDNGEPIDFYVLRYCPNSEVDEFCKEIRVRPVNELELSELQHNTTYFFELVAHNAQGNSTPANMSLTLPAESLSEPTPILSGGAIIGISIVVVLLCLFLLDLLLLYWKKQGIIATCCSKNGKKKKPNALNSRDKKGLLKDNGESGTEDTLRRPNNGHKEFEYNKTTGIITGKHSAV